MLLIMRLQWTVVSHWWNHGYCCIHQNWICANFTSNHNAASWIVGDKLTCSCMLDHKMSFWESSTSWSSYVFEVWQRSPSDSERVRSCCGLRRKPRFRVVWNSRVLSSDHFVTFSRQVENKKKLQNNRTQNNNPIPWHLGGVISLGVPLSQYQVLPI